MKKMSSAALEALKSKAHLLKPVVLLGAKGLTPAVMEEINIALDVHELIKVKLRGQEREDRLLIKNSICEALQAECIQAIGGILVLYRKNPKK